MLNVWNYLCFLGGLLLGLFLRELYNSTQQTKFEKKCKVDIDKSKQEKTDIDKSNQEKTDTDNLQKCETNQQYEKIDNYDFKSDYGKYITLQPHTRCLPVIKSEREIILPHITHVMITNGFTFRLVGDTTIYTLGQISKKYNPENRAVEMNPKTIMLRKNTPYYDVFSETHTILNTSLKKMYYCLPQNFKITLPQETVFNDGTDLFKLKNDTIALVA